MSNSCSFETVLSHILIMHWCSSRFFACITFVFGRNRKRNFDWLRSSFNDFENCIILLFCRTLRFNNSFVYICPLCSSYCINCFRSMGVNLLSQFAISFTGFLFSVRDCLQFLFRDSMLCYVTKDSQPEVVQKAC